MLFFFGSLYIGVPALHQQRSLWRFPPLWLVPLAWGFGYLWVGNIGVSAKGTAFKVHAASVGLFFAGSVLPMALFSVALVAGVTGLVREWRKKS
jgi:hypothetical protein